MDDDDDSMDESAFMAEQRETFDTFCRGLRDNNVAYAGFQVVIDSDATALQLAQSLAGNTSLVALSLVLYPAQITHPVANVLGKAIQKSAVKSLTMSNDDFLHETVYPAEPTNRMWSFYSEAVINIYKLNIFYDLQDKDATRLAWLLFHKKFNRLVHLRLLLGNLTEELAVLALSKGIQNSAITDIEIGNATPQVCRMLLSTGVLKVPTLCRVSMNVSNLYHYDTSFLEEESVFENFGIQNATACLQQASNLESIVLNECYLKDVDVKLLATAMRGNQNMKELRLDGGFITDEGVAFLAESCESCLQLEELDLSKNKIGVAGLLRLLKAMSDHPKWNSLCLDGNAKIGLEELGSMDSKHVMDEIHHHPFQLPHTLLLSDCGLTPKDLTFLFSERFCAKKLKLLDLGRNKFGDDVAVMLTDLLKKGLIMLEELRLWDNQFTVHGVQKLVRLTSTHPSLKVLDVSSMDIGYPGLAMIAEDLPTSKLTRLFISGDYFVKDGDDVDAKSPRAVAQREAGTKAGQAFFNAVKSNMYLQELYLCDMKMPEKMKSNISGFLQLVEPGRQVLRMDDGGLHLFGLWSHVLAKCSNKSSTLFYLLGEQPWIIPTFGNLGRSRECSNSATTNDSGKRPMALAESDQVGPSAKKTRVG